MVNIKFGEFTLSRYILVKFKLAIRIIVSAVGTHAIIYIGEFIIWQSLLNSPNRQIKNLAKVFYYMLFNIY